MARSSTFYSTAFVAILSAYMAACGGGGDGYTDQAEQPVKMGRFEFAPGYCQFDSVRMQEVAAAQYPDEYAQCRHTFAGNKANGQPWPTERSWPSTPDLSKEYPA